MHPLQTRIEQLFVEDPIQDKAEALRVFIDFRSALERGEIRAASPPKAGGDWTTKAWVKQGILLGFRLGDAAEMGDPRVLTFVDKATFPPRVMRAQDGVRVVAGGSAIRAGAYVAPGVICAPPMYINTGAYVDEGSMVDSHALVGSCAQIGKRVHISAGAQIGGVLEPVGASPVIIEDDVLVGGNCGVYEGTHIRRRAVLAAGVILTRGTPLFDIVKAQIYRATTDHPLVIPEGAVVVPGSRAINIGPGKDWNLSLYAPVIVKYRDEKTDASATLEDLLR